LGGGPSQQSNAYDSVIDELNNASSSSSATTYVTSPPSTPLTPPSAWQVNIYEPDFVTRTLQAKLDGQSAFEYAKKNGGCLKKEHRVNISNILISAVLEPHPSRAILVNEFQYLADEICRVFPGEVNPDLYYEKPVPKFLKNGSGTLLAASLTMRKKRRCSVEGNRKKRTTPSQSPKRSTESVPDPVVLSNIEYLKNTTGDESNLAYLWEETHSERIKEIYKPGNVIEYLEQYPCLLLSDGYKLVSNQNVFLRINNCTIRSLDPWGIRVCS